MLVSAKQVNIENMSNPKIITVIGARPQFIKCAALSPALRNYFNEVIVHTGQHYDKNLSDNFFTELNIPEPNINLYCGGGNAIEQIAQIMLKLNEVVLSEKPQAIIVFGDTNSTAAAAIVAAKNNVKLVHIEAGMREFDKTIPEETNKLITDALADYYFCATPTAVKWLADMGITKHVYHTGDVMIDLIEQHKTQIEDNTNILTKLGVQKKQYAFATCHRAANTDNRTHLEEILLGLSRIPLPVVLTLHPRTKKAIEDYQLNHLLKSDNIITCNPLGYIDTQTLIHYAKVVITDSGGVTKETYYHKVPGILTDKQTEWVETVNEGWNAQAGPNALKIVDAYNNLKIPSTQNNVLGTGQSSVQTAELLHSLMANIALV